MEDGGRQLGPLRQRPRLLVSFLAGAHLSPWEPPVRFLVLERSRLSLKEDGGVFFSHWRSLLEARQVLHRSQSPARPHPAHPAYNTLGRSVPLSAWASTSWHRKAQRWHFLAQTARRFFSISGTPPALTPSGVPEYCCLVFRQGKGAALHQALCLAHSVHGLTNPATICQVHPPHSIPLHSQYVGELAS